MVIIALVSRSRNFYLAGLVPLFPTFTLIAHYIVGTQRSHAELKITILFSMWAVIPYFIYLLSSYFLIDKMRLAAALGCSVLLWCISAALLLYIWKL